MALLNDALEGSFPLVLVGIGAALLAPVVAPALGSVAKPLAKGAVKGYLAIADRAKEVLAETGEQWSDLVAEVRAESVASTPAAQGAVKG